MDSPTEFLHQLRSRFLTTDYGYLITVAISPNDEPATGANNFCFQSRYFRFRSGGKPLAFRVNIRVTLDRFSRGCERRVIPVDLGWATTSSRAISASGGSKGQSRAPTQQSACYWVQQNKTPYFHVGSADFNGKYTKLR